jgi:hypothetical protein
VASLPYLFSTDGSPILISSIWFPSLSPHPIFLPLSPVYPFPNQTNTGRQAAHGGARGCRRVRRELGQQLALGRAGERAPLFGAGPGAGLRRRRGQRPGGTRVRAHAQQACGARWASGAGPAAARARTSRVVAAAGAGQRRRCSAHGTARLGCSAGAARGPARWLESGGGSARVQAGAGADLGTEAQEPEWSGELTGEQERRSVSAGLGKLSGSGGRDGS